MSSALPCDRGFYCPGESASRRPCPAGSYGNVTGLADERRCSRCDPGMFCDGTGRLGGSDVVVHRHRWVADRGLCGTGTPAPTGPCSAGFVCVGGASEPSPTDPRTGFPCPPGFFCPLGTFSPTPCPTGTFRCRFSGSCSLGESDASFTEETRVIDPPLTPPSPAHD